MKNEFKKLIYKNNDLGSENKRRLQYLKKRSIAEHFIRQYATLEDIETLNFWIEERKKFWEGTVKEILKYIEVIKDLLVIDTKVVFGKYDFIAKYFPVEDIVKVSNDILGKDLVYTLYVITHELRHAYQHQEIEFYNFEKTELTEDIDIVKNWKSEFENYISLGFPGYEKQSVEIDAHAFARHILSISLNIKFDDIEDFDTAEILKRQKEIAEDFVIDEVLDSFNYIDSN